MPLLLRDLAVYASAAAAEISGCFAFWMWLRLGRSILWCVPGLAALLVFACLLTLVDATAAGRVYAAYGGIYVAASLAWLRVVEQVVPDHWDLAGAAICLVGVLVIIGGPR